VDKWTEKEGRKEGRKEGIKDGSKVTRWVGSKGGREGRERGGRGGDQIQKTPSWDLDARTNIPPWHLYLPRFLSSGNCCCRQAFASSSCKEDRSSASVLTFL
jgi:hypothetical protein